ncbi:MAG: gspJ [Verrucomicrobiales bacterium]|nr:gspJ [Verrucomicrobiales bacterium]
MKIRNCSMLAQSSAFTLIEIVISAALMSLILVSAYFCLSSAVASQKIVESRSETLQNARIAMEMMSADLRCASPLSTKIEFLGSHRMIGEVEGDNLDFGTHNYTPKHANEGDFCETSYFLKKDPQFDRYALWRRRDPTPDPEPLAGGRLEEIARGVRSLKFEYYDGFDWYDDWGDINGAAKIENSLKDHPNLSGMPESVRITLTLDVGRPAAGKDASEPPLVFQTIARLNLSAIAAQTSSTSASNRVSNTSGQEAPPEGAPQ